MEPSLHSVMVFALEEGHYVVAELAQGQGYVHSRLVPRFSVALDELFPAASLTTTASLCIPSASTQLSYASWSRARPTGGNRAGCFPADRSPSSIDAAHLQRWL